MKPTLLFKHEDQTDDGVPIGPLFIRQDGTTSKIGNDWVTLTKARHVGKLLNLPLEEC